MEALGVTAREIDIRPVVPSRCCATSSHPYAERREAVYDITFENVQAGERTATCSGSPTTTAAS